MNDIGTQLRDPINSGNLMADGGMESARQERRLRVSTKSSLGVMDERANEESGHRYSRSSLLYL